MIVKEFEALFELSYDFFDQDIPFGGWRGIEDDFQAAMIIDAYHLQHYDTLDLTQHRMLYFHAGQSYAFAGINNLALDRFKKSIMTEEQQDYKERWNAYAQGTIAFIANDMDNLVAAKERLKQVDPGNNGTLVILENLIEGFGKPYHELLS